MKIKSIWITIAAAVIGITLGLLLPKSGSYLEVFEFITLWGIRLIRLTLLPFLFFSLGVAVCKQRRERKLGKTTLMTVGFLIGMTVLVVLLGTFFTLMIGPKRIPVPNQDMRLLNPPELKATLLSLVPENFFHLFTGNGTALLPMLAFAFLLGFHLNFDREVAEPTFNFFDSLSRILYRINRYLIDAGALILSFITVLLLVNLRQQDTIGQYLRLIIIVSGFSAITLFGIFPLLILVFNKRRNPYPALFGMISPLLTSFLSGDLFFAAPYMIRSTKENMGVPRRTGALSLPVSLLFGRMGTAAVSAISMLFILKSYSSLELTFFQIFWVILYSILISFILFQVPSAGVYLSLSILCGMYGRGLENGFQVMVPVLPLLQGLGSLIDTAGNLTLSTIIAKQNDTIQEVTLPEMV